MGIGGISIGPPAAGATPGLVKLGSVTATGAAATMDLVGIPATSKHLLCVLNVQGDGNVNEEDIGIRFNGDAGANYAQAWISDYKGAAQPFGGNALAQITLTRTSPGAVPLPNTRMPFMFMIPEYAGVVSVKAITGVSYNLGGINTFTDGRAGGGKWLSTAAINRITVLIPSSGNKPAAGGTLDVYGLS